MFGTFVIGLIVVVWLFVLLPLVLRNRRPIRHAGEGLDDTRIVFAGDSATPAPRRRPRLGPIDTHGDGPETDTSPRDTVGEYELLDNAESDTAEAGGSDVPDPRDGDGYREEQREHGRSVIGRFLVTLLGRDTGTGEDDGFPGTEETDGDTGAAAVSDRRRAAAEEIRSRMRSRTRTTEQDTIEILEGEVVPELPALAAQSETVDTVVVSAADFDEDDEEAFRHDDAYTDPADLLHPAGDYRPADDTGEEYDYGDEPRVVDIAEAEDTEPELTDEDIAFAASRRGRGGFDPETHDAYAAARFRRRQRTLIILAVLLPVGLGIGFLFGGPYWLAPAAVGLLLGMYLYALRTQVMAEQELRARRIRQIRRARLGVRNAADAELGVPARLRRPGAIVLEIDDESPDFHELELREGHAAAGPDEDTVIDLSTYHPRRAG
ncbi:hypothetical protein M0E82_08930 [Corynebacterium sp. P7202]|uniref:DUF3329 domain-containing protein n=1 Tax=Corynebacterium pygosceleis TaxID=2800406 RepID=A0A9Q4CAY6_9CORY|nr:gephyrin-like molybdotransferase receptor GlpR [Corynebacterium pygosceleis]MCK7638117.1 hypothetical protein [Corynebacterium pygosceleis]MCX7444328.1 hypothetical protein [Corynebacterium pygosceleis]MCX7468833.1 hypothetical protein [Corynebacterium pygosceleis]